MKRNVFGIALFITVAWLTGTQAVDTNLYDPADAQMGINFTHLMDWSPEYPFVNILHNARPWTSLGNGWGDGRPIDEDENGYVRSLIPAEGTNKAQSVVTLIGTGGAAYPSGDYLFLFDGQAATTNIYFTQGASNVTVLATGRWLVQCNSLDGDKAIMMEIRSIPDTNNYPRNLRLILPGYHNYTNQLDTNQVFTTGFLNRWQDFKVFRFMNWMKTNGSIVSNWAGRTPPGYLFYTRDSGAPYEVLIDLCNLTGANPWFNIPHLADANFVTNFAALVKERLDTNLFPIIEFSNETWNGIFPQNWYAQEQGVVFWPELAAEPWQAGQNWYGMRSMQVHSIFTNVYGGHEHLVRVAQGQASGPGIATKMMAANPGLASNLDAYAIAPYIEMNVSGTSSGRTPTLDEFAAMDLDGIFDWLISKTLPDTIVPRMQSNYTFAQSNNLPLITYEGGQSITLKASTGYANSNGWKVAAANKDPRMADLYMRYFKEWKNTGGGLFTAYSSSTGYSTNGAWVMAFGAFWDNEQPNDESPKYNGLLFSGLLSAANEPRFIVSTNWITAAEGSTNAFQIKLSSAPVSPLTASVTRLFGDTNVTVDTSALGFDSGNWNSWQPVNLSAGEDADYKTVGTDTLQRCNGTAIVQLRANGLPDAGVVVYEADNDFDPDYSLPWSETFENDPAMAGQAGPLDGQHGWIASSAGAVVQSATAYNSAQSAGLHDVQISRLFADGQTGVWARLYLRPVYGQTNTGVATASAAFWIGDAGQILAYSNSTVVALPVSVAEGVWSEFLVHLDYGSQRWSLTVNGTNAATSLGFHSVKNGFQSLEIAQDEKGTNAYIDGITLSPSELLSDFQAPDSDSDGIPDWWETQYFGGATNANPSATASNGVNTVLEAYIAGISPVDPSARFLISDLRPLASESILQWQNASGRVYTVYWTSNLLNSFQPLEAGIPWTANTFTDSLHSAENQGFYKIEVELE